MDCGGRRSDGDVQDYISLNVTCKSLLSWSLGSQLPSFRTFLFFSFLLFLSSLSCLCLFVLPSSLLVLLFPPLVLPVSNFLFSCSFSHFFLVSSHLNFSLICLCVIRSSYFLLSLTFGLHFSLPLISLYCIFFLSRRLKWSIQSCVKVGSWSCCTTPFGSNFICWTDDLTLTLLWYRVDFIIVSMTTRCRGQIVALHHHAWQLVWCIWLLCVMVKLWSHPKDVVSEVLCFVQMQLCKQKLFLSCYFKEKRFAPCYPPTCSVFFQLHCHEL